jgi:Zn-dependent alcohol dehydrogenase
MGDWTERTASQLGLEIPSPTRILVNSRDFFPHLLKLEDINKGFDLMHAGESIRSVVVY